MRTYSQRSCQPYKQAAGCQLIGRQEGTKGLFCNNITMLFMCVRFDGSVSTPRKEPRGVYLCATGKPLFVAYKARLIARIQLVQRRENEVVTRGNRDRRQLRLQ